VAKTPACAIKKKDGTVFVKRGDDRARDSEDVTKVDPIQFALTKESYANLQSNMQHLFVAPMTTAIKQTVGEPLMQSASLIQKATQIQSLFQQAMFSRLVKETLDAKSQGEGNEKARFDGLSRKEKDDIMEQVMNAYPLINTEGNRQSFFVAGSQSTDVNATAFGESLDGKFRSPGFVYGPMDSGVAGIPFMVIGTGDGQMMQTLSTMKGAPKDSTKIFDGVNFSLHSLESDSAKANQAVYDAWQGNPMQAVSTMFDKSMTGFQADFESMPDALKAKVLRALIGPKEVDEQDIDTRGLFIAMQNDLQRSAMEIQARQNVVATVAHNIDQMAAAGSPYVHKGTQLQGTNHEEIAAELEALRQVELVKLQAKRTSASDTRVTAPKKSASNSQDTVAPASKLPTGPFSDILSKGGQSNIPSGLLTLGKLHTKSNVRILSPTSVAQYAKQLGLNSAQAAIFTQIRLSKVASNYKVIYGSPEELNAYADSTGLPRPSLASSDGVTHGLTDPTTQTIWLVNPTNAETLVHELIHASTFSVLQAVMEGRETTPEVVDAVKRISALMEEFKVLGAELQRPDVHLGANTLKAVQDSLAAIKEWQEADPTIYDQSDLDAAALGEFMAWGLANQHLAAIQQRVTSPLAKLAKSIVASIKAILFPKSRIPKQADDMLSHLVFNTSILIRAQSTLQQQAATVSLAHNEKYGEDQRLAGISDTYMRTMVDYANTSPVDYDNSGHVDPKAQAAGDRVNRKSEVTEALERAQIMGERVASVFSMNPQQFTTFQLLTAALGTAAHVDSNALSTGQTLFTHVNNLLSPMSFMAEGMSEDHPNYQRDLSYAEEKHAVITGQVQGYRDSYGRSSLLPVFLALATVHDEFRAVLAKMPVPKTMLEKGNTLDGILTNAGTIAMDSLSAVMSGASRSRNVVDAVDALSQRIREVTADRQTLLDQVASPIGRMADRGNQMLVDLMGYLAGKANQGADALVARANNKATRLVQAAAKATNLLVSEEKADLVAQDLMSHINKMERFRFVHDQINNIVGRTENNKGVYDLLKQILSGVQADAQQFREVLPSTIDKMFTQRLSNEQYSTLFRGLGKTDLAALAGHFSVEQVMDMLQDPVKGFKASAALEKSLEAQDPQHWKLVQAKAKQLAKAMNGGPRGSNFLRNAEAVADLLGEKTAPKRKTPDAKYVSEVDQLTSLYAFQGLGKADMATLKDLAINEPKGMQFIHSYMIGNRAEETRKAGLNGMAKYNNLKGYVPSLQQDGLSMLIADDTRSSELLERSYQRVGDYQGSSADVPHVSQGYYFAPVSRRSPFSQGIMQNVQQTVNGVDANTGLSLGLTGGRVVNPDEVKRVTRALANEKAPAGETLNPIYAPNGRVVAYERSADPTQLLKLNQDQHLGKMIGVWRGRQAEEINAHQANMTLIDALKAMYDADKKKTNFNPKQYVNLYDEAELLKDPVLGDAVKLFSDEARQYIQEVFGSQFMVRRDMLNDAVGYRNASVTDSWTGVTRYSEATQKVIKNLGLSIWGNDAYRKLYSTEKTVQNVVKDAKTLIVVKSLVVPASNFVSNVYQMMTRGISPLTIARALPKKLAEVHSYTTSRLRQNEAEAELRVAQATKDVTGTRRLTAEIQSIQDAHSRLSIWPLIQAGEFSGVSDAGISRDDVLLTSGRLNAYMEQLADRLPGPFRTLGRYALVTKDTALFQGMQKAVEYGDFLAKAITYDHLTIKKGMTKDIALGRVSEEYINYDRLPGRARGALEGLGLLWFYNYKLRALKIAASMVRENPLHALLTGLLPTPSFLPGVGTPLGDNFLSKGIEHGLAGSVGPGMLFRAAKMNPVAHVLGIVL
jgi:hypothetical protein